MLSRNNWQEQMEKFEPKKQRFTIKKLSVGVASVLLGVAFAGNVSADTTNANADSSSDSDSAEQTDHNLVLNSNSTSTLKNATAANQEKSASAAIQNSAGDVQTPVASEYEAAVSSAVNSNVASAASNVSATSNKVSEQSAASTSAAPASNALETQTLNINPASLTAMTEKAAQTSLYSWSDLGNDILKGILREFQMLIIPIKLILIITIVQQIMALVRTLTTRL